MNLAKFLAKKTKQYKCAYLSRGFVDNLIIDDRYYKKRKFNKILWDYLPDSDPEVLSILGQEIAKKAREKNAEIIIGIETSSIHLAGIASVYAGLNFGYVRKNPKAYGLKKRIEGHFKTKKKVFLVDNFLFTGGTLLRAYDNIYASGLLVVGAIVVDDFENLTKVKGLERIPYISLVKNSNKIQYLLEENYFPKELKSYLKTYVTNPDLFYEKSDFFENYLKILLKYSDTDLVITEAKAIKRYGFIPTLKKSALNFLRQGTV